MNAARTEHPSILAGMETEGNEWLGGTGRASAFLRRCEEAFSSLSKAERARRQKFLDRAVSEFGSDFTATGFGNAPRHVGHLDLFPRYIRSEEWKRISAGIVQRLRAFSAYVEDVFGGQAILRRGVISPEVVLRDPAYFVELSSLGKTQGPPFLLAAVDLVRTASGEWQVSGQNCATPSGIAQILQIRRLMAQAVPELFDRFAVSPVASFTSRFAEALAAQAPASSSGKPLVVMLSEGEHGSAYFEESFLARHMGMVLCQPADLLVRESRLFLRTIHGLIPVDVVYRRLGGPAIDPVAFGNANPHGIPGLLQCVRHGGVTVTNSLGSEVASNRALLRHSDEIVRFYLGEQALLKSVATYSGFDEDEREAMLEQQEQLTFAPVTDPRILRERHPEAAEAFSNAEFARLLREHPLFVTGQAMPKRAVLPVYRTGANECASATLRVFCLMQDPPVLLPGGLSWIEEEGSNRITRPVQNSASVHFKDTWVDRSEPQPARKVVRSRLEALLDPGDLPIPSRVAESMYWIGRYVERAQNTARMALILEDLRWDELTPDERKLYTPLWIAVLEATSQNLKKRKREAPGDFKQIRRLTNDPKNTSSVLSCLHFASQNGYGIRGFITPEFWRSLRRAQQFAGRFEKRMLSRTQFRDYAVGIIDACDLVGGSGARTLLHDAGWRFFLAGRYLERGVTHVTILLDLVPVIARRQLEHMRDDTDLTALLRLMGALDAYHREYRSRAYLDRVARLLWQNPHLPASLSYALIEIRAALGSLTEEGGATIHGMVEELGNRIDRLQAIDIARIFPARALELDHGVSLTNLSVDRTIEQVRTHMEETLTFLAGLHEQLEDRFFSHQEQEQREDARS